MAYGAADLMDGADYCWCLSCPRWPLGGVVDLSIGSLLILSWVLTNKHFFSLCVLISSTIHYSEVRINWSKIANASSPPRKAVLLHFLHPWSPITPGLPDWEGKSGPIWHRGATSQRWQQGAHHEAPPETGEQTNLFHASLRAPSGISNAAT